MDPLTPAAQRAASSLMCWTRLSEQLKSLRHALDATDSDTTEADEFLDFIGSMQHRQAELISEAMRDA